jgi:hypothetical protein
MYSLPSHVQLTINVLKLIFLKLPFVSSCCMPLFNTIIAQHVSAYLTIKCIKFDGEIAALLYTVVTHVDILSNFMI